MIRFIFSKAFLLNLLIALAVLFGSYFVLNNFLTEYTRHGQTVTVPNVMNEHVDDLPELLEKKGFRFEITDSTWIRKEKKGAVLEQLPKAGELVKEGRKIYIKINARTNKKVRLNLENVLKAHPRIAREILQSLDVKVDRYEIKTSEYENQTLAVKDLQGNELKTGDLVYAGAKLILVISEQGKGVVKMPNVVGKSIQDAREIIESNNLSITIFPTVDDCNKKREESKVKVRKQDPAPNEEIKTGGRVILSFECDSIK